MPRGYSETGQGLQERGPNTFALRTPGTAEAARAPGTQEAVQAGIRGGGPGLTAGAPHLDTSQADRTLQELVKVGQSLLAPHMKRITEEKFVEGVTAAASGQALTEIINEQPWYTRIFGDGPLVEGARAYSVQTKAAEWAAGIDAQMPTLRKRAPSEVPGFLSAGLNAVNTGDAAADTALRAHMVQAIPGVIKRHTKEHYQFLQEDMLEKYTANAAAAGTVLQGAMGSDKAGPPDQAGAKVAFMSSITPPEFMDPKAADTALKGFVGLFAEQGNFHAINTLRESGLLDQMSPQDRVTAERSINAFAAFHRTRGKGAELLLAQAPDNAARDTGNLSAAEWLARTQARNAQFQAATGNPEPLIGAQQQAAGVETAAQLVYQTVRQEQARIDKIAGREQADAASAAFWQQQALSGTTGVALAGHEGKKADADRGFVAAMDNMPGATPEQQHTNRVRMVVNAAVGGYVNDLVKNQYMQGLRSLPEAPSDQFKQAYQKWADINAQPDGGAARIGYFGAETDARLSKFHSMMQNMPAGAIGFAYTEAMTGPLTRVAPTKDEKALVQGIISKETGKWFPGELGGPLRAEAAATVTRELHDAMALYKGMAPELGSDEIAKRALHEVKAKGLELYGGWAWKNPQGLAKPLHEVLPHAAGGELIPRSEIGGLFSTVLKAQQAAYLPGRDPGRMEIMREPDANGVARWTVWYGGTGGLGGTFPLNSELLVAEFKRRRELAVRQPEALPGDAPSLASPRTLYPPK